MVDISIEKIAEIYKKSPKRDDYKLRDLDHVDLATLIIALLEKRFDKVGFNMERLIDGIKSIELAGQVLNLLDYTAEDLFKHLKYNG